MIPGLRISHGPGGIRRVGHRRYVGGLWDEIGALQYEFLLRKGLLPHHYLLDIGCGSLRAGIHFIPYLEAGHYLGIDKEESLIRSGIERELGLRLFEEKRPQLMVSDSFEFAKFDARPDYALAQSLFTHLPPEIIRLCLAKLRPVIRDDGVFFATYFETGTPASNPSKPHDHLKFAYTRREMEGLGVEQGWEMEYLGDWEHPRGQIMVKYAPT